MYHCDGYKRLLSKASSRTSALIESIVTVLYLSFVELNCTHFVGTSCSSAYHGTSGNQSRLVSLWVCLFDRCCGLLGECGVNAVVHFCLRAFCSNCSGVVIPCWWIVRMFGVQSMNDALSSKVKTKTNFKVRTAASLVSRIEGTLPQIHI